VKDTPVIHIETSPIIGMHFHQRRRWIAWTVNDFGEREYGPRRFTERGARNALLRVLGHA
jgi:hypothetical protein